MCMGKNRSGAKKPNNGHPKKERGVVVSRFEPGTKGRVFFSPSSTPSAHWKKTKSWRWDGWGGLVKSKAYQEHS